MVMTQKREVWLTLEEAAELFSRSTTTIRNYIKAGHIRAYTKPLDRRVYVRFDELDALFNREPRPVEKRENDGE